jgi:hypothetical protein
MNKEFVQGRWGVNGGLENGAHGETRPTIVGCRCVRRDHGNHIMDSLAPAHSALAGLWLRRIPFAVIPSGSSHKICNVIFAQSLFGYVRICALNRKKVAAPLAIRLRPRHGGYYHNFRNPSQAVQVPKSRSGFSGIAACKEEH